tara:strand:- start:2871 stop:3344 length:474 start_codon:yes stop_codon:yes gene_type:complete
MLMCNGLRCVECGFIEDEVYYERNDGPTKCPECEGARKVDWSHGCAPAAIGDGLGTFVPKDMGVLGYCETREDYDRAVARIKTRFPGHRVELEQDSATKKSTRVDEARHRAWKKERASGLDSKMVKAMKSDAKRLKSTGEKNHPVATKSHAQLASGG